MMSYAAVVLVASMSLGQVDRRTDTDDFKKLRGFFGTWEATDVDMGGQSVGRVSASWKPILRGSFIEHRYIGTDEAGNVTLRGLVIFGREPADDKVRGWGFDSVGGFMAMELVGWDGDKSNWATTFVSADGAVQKSEANTFELPKNGGYAWMLAIAGGDKSEAVLKRARRKKERWPERQVDAPASVVQQMKDVAWWAGDFTTEGSDAFTGKAIVGQSTCGWILDGKFLLYDIASIDDDLEVRRYRAIVGVDPATGQTTGWEFNATGTVGKYAVTDGGQSIVGKGTSPDSGLHEYNGRLTKNANGFEYKATGKLPDGKKTNYHGVWRKRN